MSIHFIFNSYSLKTFKFDESLKMQIPKIPINAKENLRLSTSEI